MNKILIVSFALLLAGCSSGPSTKAVPPASAGALPTFVVRSQTLPNTVEIAGTVRSAQSAQMAAQVMATVTKVLVHEGDRVKKGQLLLTLDARALGASLDQASAGVTAARGESSAAQSDFDLAQSTLQRYQGLQEKNSVSPHEMDEVRARFESAKARRDRALAGVNEAESSLQQARTVAGYSQIRAPFDGVVTARYVDEGTLAAPGAPLVTVEDPSSYRLEITVDESDIALVQPNAAVPVTIDALDSAAIAAHVARIVPAADPRSRSFLVKLELPRDAHLRSGLYGRAQLARGVRGGLVAPMTAVVDRGQVQGVYVVGADRVASLRFVTVGGRSGNDVELLSGVQPGERVVATPGDRDLAGMRVEE
jgi:RND family efflux transporter MFP subunit